MDIKIFSLGLFFVSSLSMAAVPTSLDVSHSKFSFQLSEKKTTVEYKTRYAKGSINTAKCEKNFLKDLWLIYSFKKDNLRTFEKSAKMNKNFIRVKEDKNTFFVSQTSDLGMFLSRMPNTLFNLNLREQRLCKK